MAHLGDYTEDYATLNFKFTTRQSTGAPFTLAGTPVISVYKANDLTQSVAGLTLTVDFDSVTGLNNVLIDLSADAFYATANDYQAVITAGTVNGVSVVGEVIGEFSIDNRSNITVAQIYNEVLTGAAYNINNSAGKRIREAAEKVIESGTAQTGSTVNTIKLATGASATDGAYDPALVTIVAGTGAGQSRMIFQYDGTTKIAVVDRNWKVTPDNTSEYVIYAHAGREHVNEGLAQAGGTATITLNALASSSNDAYKGQIVFIRSGTGDDQAKVVISYNGITKVAIVHEPWSVVPDATSAYVMMPIQVETAEDIAHAVWDDLTTDHSITDSFAVAIKDTLVDTGTTIPATLATLPVATDIVTSGAISTSAGSVVNVTTTDTTTTNTDMVSAAPTVVQNRTEMDSNSTKLASLLVDTTDIKPRVVAIESETVNRLGKGIILNTAATGTLTTTSATTNLSGYGDNQLVGAVIMVTSGAAEGERKDILTYTSVGGVITFAAMTVAMSNNDTFKLI